MRAIRLLLIVAAVSGWVGVPAGVSALPVLINASEDITKFGNLKQADVTSCPNDACGPTSAVNSFVFLQKSFPQVYDSKLIEHDPANVANDPYRDLVFTANRLATDAFMRTCTICGTFPDDFAVGKDRWINGFGATAGHAPGTTTFGVQDEFAWGAGNALPPDRLTPPTYFRQKTPDSSFFISELRKMEDIEILLNGDPNHWVTVTSFSFTDLNDNNVLDGAEVGTIGFIDPADGANRIRPLKLTGGEIVVDYRQNGTFSARIVSAESESTPIPEPATVVLLIVGVAGLAAGRRLLVRV